MKNLIFLTLFLFCRLQADSQSYLLNNSGKSVNLNIEMVAVKGGNFFMGCTAEQGDQCWDDERPVQRVSVSDFFIGKFEVTQAQWIAVMGNNPSFFKGDNLPVECVSWNDVQEFIRRLNTQSNVRYRLPTEAEWEFAARGGNSGKGNKFSGSNSAHTVAWCQDNSGQKTHPVGTKSPNELGIYDMSGNVWEWCSDWHNDYFGDIQTNPQGYLTGVCYVTRGGSWDDFSRRVRVSARGCDAPNDGGNYLGFRLAYSYGSR